MAPDLIAIPYFPGYTPHRDAAVLDWVRTHRGPRAVIMSVCGGIEPLPDTGLLGVRFTDDGPFITSTNLAASIDATLHAVGRLAGRGVAEDIARQLGYRRTAYLDDPPRRAGVSALRHGPDRPAPGGAGDQSGPPAERRAAPVDHRQLRLHGRRVPGHHGHPRRPDRPPSAAPARCRGVRRGLLGGAIGVARQLPAGLGGSLVEVAREAFVQGMRTTSAISVAVALALALLAPLLLRDVPSGSGPGGEPGQAPTPEPEADRPRWSLGPGPRPGSPADPGGSGTGQPQPAAIA